VHALSRIVKGAIDVQRARHAGSASTVARRRPAAAGPQWALTLFDSWALRRARVDVHVHRREQRLIAVLALQGERTRDYVAGVLWPESSQHHATGNLRAAVWRIRHDAPGLLVNDRAQLRLTKPLDLDVDVFTRTALRVLGSGEDGRTVNRATCRRILPVLLRGELLPGWYDDWVCYERARLMQLRLQALEILADLLVDAGQTALARVAAAAAVTIEPLHEPATRALVRAELGDNDYSSALRDYEAYRVLLQSELGVPPSDRLAGLVGPLLGRRFPDKSRRRPVAV
jgi:DNA-binding SARP family transcriptional activator